MIKRRSHIKALETLLSRHPVVGIVGARQVGKTTLARVLAVRSKRKVHYFDLENPDDLNMLREPMMALKNLRGLVVIDEVQRHPGIFQVLRVLVDRPRTPAHPQPNRRSDHRLVDLHDGNLRALLDLVGGKVHLRSVTIPEGLTVRETAALLEEQGPWKAAAVLAAARDASLVADLDPKAPNLEGYLFPETYFYSKETPAGEMVRAMVEGFRTVLDDALRARAETSPTFGMVPALWRSGAARAARRCVPALRQLPAVGDRGRGNAGEGDRDRVTG